MSAVAEVHYLTQPELNEVSTRFDSETGAYWAFMKPTGRPCFSHALLDDLISYIRSIQYGSGAIWHDGSHNKVRYGVLASKRDGVFNLGGDLSLFRGLIDAQDREGLFRYGTKCIDALYPWYRNCDLDMTTIALVQGDALGGGFEAALSASVLIAEESARMGFPEILFNLFPGMGAYSFLLRKVGRRTAEELITSGNIYSARDLFEMGIVDVITADGTGVAATESYIKKHARNANGRRAFERARGEVLPITRQELARVVEIWTDAALKLQDRDLRMMERLVRAQAKSDLANPATGDNVIALSGGNRIASFAQEPSLSSFAAD